MHFAPLLSRYGAWAVLLGAALEGESVVVAGGMLAHRGFFPPLLSGAAAFAGSFLADQLCFAIGRTSRDGRIVRWARGKAAFARAIDFVDRYPTGFVLAFRFIYGLRIAGPIAIGVSHVRAWRFLVLNAVSAAIWGAVFTALGFVFGHAVEEAFHRFGWSVRIGIAAGAVVVAGGAVFAVHRWRRSRRTRTGLS